MANQESDEDSCPERPGGAEGPLCIPDQEIGPEQHRVAGFRCEPSPVTVFSSA